MNKATLNTLLIWSLGDDTGVSSQTMVKIALGIKSNDDDEWYDFDAPHDPSDFGRCYRLVKLCPELKQSFKRIGLKCKQFKGILNSWDELCELYEFELPKGRAPALYARIKELRGDK